MAIRINHMYFFIAIMCIVSILIQGTYKVGGIHKVIVPDPPGCGNRADLCPDYPEECLKTCIIKDVGLAKCCRGELCCCEA
ncbi:hypothetical protein RYX36_009878 [Vicia faba]